MRFYEEQLRVFSLDALGGAPLRAYNPLSLSERQDEKVLAIDIGGDKIRSAVFCAKDGKVQKVSKEKVFSSSAGVGYSDFLEEQSVFAQEQSLPVGISSAGVIEDNRLLLTANMPAFFHDLRARYDGSFANLFLDTFRVVENDAIMGLVAASAHVKKRDPEQAHVIFLINGSGIGGAVLKDNVMWKMSPGHVPVIDALNPFDQQEKCHNSANDFVCIEKVAAGKAGIEILYARKKGEKVSGKQISERAKSGDGVAGELYDNSARVIAHALVGIVNAFAMEEKVAIVGHGGCFEAPGYAEKVQQYTQSRNEHTVFSFSKDFTDNICLEGAAVAAISSLRASGFPRSRE